MCVCLSLFVFVPMCVCHYMLLCLYAYVHTSICMCVLMHKCTCDMCARPHLCMYAPLYMFLWCFCVHIYLHAWLCLCVHICVVACVACVCLSDVQQVRRGRRSCWRAQPIGHVRRDRPMRTAHPTRNVAASLPSFTLLASTCSVPFW